MNPEQFRDLLQQKGEELYRDMPWRDDARPYYVLVSELMLQQTQVPRVLVKFEEFITLFPDENTLAKASLADVLIAWQGLGYNRRAKFLHEAAKRVARQGKFPATLTDLLALPGVGVNTAGAILAYSFNQPSIFIETNIRTVYIHHFFNDRFDVDDKEIKFLLEKTIDYSNPRRFYQNIMDYGTWLKANGVRNTSSSKHYKKQPVLKGSVREVRGQIIRLLTSSGVVSTAEVMKQFGDDERLKPALDGLIADKLVTIKNDTVYLTK